MTFPALAEPMSVLDRREPITAVKAFDCYKQYEDELKGKSQRELDSCLQQLLSKSDKRIRCSRPKLVALMEAGARFSYSIQKGNIDKFVSITVQNDDIPLVQYALEQKFIDPNHCHILSGLSPLWQCTSTDMANLLLLHGADIAKKGIYKENIVHHLCSQAYGNSKATHLIHLYCSIHPQLIHQMNTAGKTPLLQILDHFFWAYPEICERYLPVAYTLLNLGAKTDVYALQGAYTGKTPSEIVITHADESSDPRVQEKLLELAAYIQHPTDSRSSLFERLMFQWRDKI
jgi:hypothetical protein